MARKQVQPCIFCGEIPCACDGKSATKLKPSSGPRKTTTVATILGDDLEPKDTVFPADIPTAPVSRFVAPVHEVSQEELQFNQAIRTLNDFGLLRPIDQKNFEAILKPRMKADTERDLLEWRRNHGILPGNDKA